MQPTSHYLIFETAFGFCGMAWNGAGVSRFQLPFRDAGATERALLRRQPDLTPDSPSTEVSETITAVQRYFDGQRIDFSGVPVDLNGQDALSRRIYAATRRLSWGEATTYGTLAKALGAGPEVARDVGQAMAHNPVPLIIPCHRVLAAGGKVGGFSAPGGSAAKARMLQLEGVRVAAPPPVQGSLVL